MMRSLYLALGDSITAGYGVGISQSFASIYYNFLCGTSPGLAYVNLGVNGLTSGALVAMLQRRKNRNFLLEANLISITIGSNDLLTAGRSALSGRGLNLPAMLENLAQNLRLCGSLLRSLTPEAVVKIATIYNPFNPVTQEFFTPSQSLIIPANQAIVSCAGQYNFLVVPVERAFRGKESALLGPDHLHPNIMGQRLIADLFAFT